MCLRSYGLLDRAAVAESALLDMLLLADCDYFAGSFSSHFSSAAFELSVFNKGFVPPYVSPARVPYDALAYELNCLQLQLCKCICVTSESVQISVDCPWRPARPLGNLTVLPACQRRVVNPSS